MIRRLSVLLARTIVRINKAITYELSRLTRLFQICYKHCNINIQRTVTQLCFIKYFLARVAQSTQGRIQDYFRRGAPLRNGVTDR